MELEVNKDEVTPVEDSTVNAAEGLAIDVNKQKEHDKIVKTIVHVVVYVLLILGALTCIFPFYWMIQSSLKGFEEYNQAVPTFFPHELTFEAYGLAFDYQNGLFVKTLINSLVVGSVSTILGVIVTILAAYAFARMKFHGKELVFSILLMTMMLPGELFTITNYVTTAKMGWSNSYIIMILPFLCSIYYIYLLRNTFKSIPETLYKAAKVDGCSDIEYLIKVMIPLAGPTIFSITLLKLIGTWNSYMWPELVNDQQWQLVSNWMSNCGSNTERAKEMMDYPVRMAASMIISIPLFIVFILFRKYIMRGVSKSGIKG
jgi:multiple sugar transport system permease protein